MHNALCLVLEPAQPVLSSHNIFAYYCRALDRYLYCTVVNVYTYIYIPRHITYIQDTYLMYISPPSTRLSPAAADAVKAVHQVCGFALIIAHGQTPIFPFLASPSQSLVVVVPIPVMLALE